MKKVLLAVGGTVLLIVAAVAFTLGSRHDNAEAGPAAQLTLAPGQLLYRTVSTGRIASVPMSDPAAAPQVSGLRCDRFAVAAQTAVCLAVRPGTLPPVTDVLVLDDHLAIKHKESLPGTPSRAPGLPGRQTAFTGRCSSPATPTPPPASRPAPDSTKWTPAGWSRRSRNWPCWSTASRYFASDANFWGITFARDDNLFYATLAS